MSIVPYPTLLIKPNGSHDRNGPVSPTLSGAVRIVPGQYGDAFFVEEGTTNLIENPMGATAHKITAYNTATLTPGITDKTALAPICVKVDTSGGSNQSNPTRGINFQGSFSGAGPVIGQLVAMGEGTVRARCVLRYQGGRYTEGAWTPAAALSQSSPTKFVTSPVTVASGETPVSCDVEIRTETFEVVTFWAAYAQVENKTYATSYCDGSLGTGYTWAGTEHASASTRAAGYVRILTNNRVKPEQGTIAARLRSPGPDAGNRTIYEIGDSTDGTGLLLARWANSSLFEGQRRARVSSSEEYITTLQLGTVPPPNTETTFEMWWDAGLVSMRLGAGPTATLPYPGKHLPLVPSITIGASRYGANTLNSRVDTVIVFDRPLTDAERTELFAMDTWEWGTLMPKLGGILTIGGNDGPIGMLSVSGHDVSGSGG